ncbi:hypothetical protein [Methylobacterium sp. GC_Met_2]|uniref:hypothetical protein n=1 Tax=Methylobacterium sp. GC_Met_2 TaxID=2937376 RepID=UPI00226B6760|nr:hypothetical protein [Methylobacterium sp. GC_Met_2]
MGKRGPAPKGEYVGQTAVLSTRLTPDLRSRLESEVEKRPNNTISREVEHRIRRSFIQEDEIISAFGSRENYALMRVISMVLELWHNPADLAADWKHDPTAYDQVCKKISAVLKAMRPPGEPQKLSDLEQALADVTATEHPAVVLKGIQDAERALPLTGSRKAQIRSLIKSDLGELADRPHIFQGTADQMRAEADRLDREKQLASPPKKRSRR